MCGICGVAWTDPSRPVDPGVLDRMTDIVAHRGPDGRGVHVEPGFGLGIRRLEIVDPEGGEQPLANEDGSVVVVCNGEIYDHVEARADLEARGHRFRTRSDTEVLVHLYEEHGLDFVSRLRGMFAFALLDRRRRRLVLGRDRLGIKPLHWAQTDQGVVFGSEIKSILASALVEPALERSALADILSLGCLRTPRTLLRGVERVEPGTLLVVEGGVATRRRYWRLDFPDDGAWPERSREAWAEAFLAELDEVVRLHERSDVPVGAWLSAGLDSSSVAALMTRHLAGRLPTFSLRFEDEECDEFGDTRALFDFDGFDLDARSVTCGTDDLRMLPRAIWHQESPEANAIAIPRLLKSELAATHVRAVLTGEGADELLGGYLWYKGDEIVRRASWLSGTAFDTGRRPTGGFGAWVGRLVAAPPEMGGARFAAMIGPMSPVLDEELLEGDDGPAPPSDALPPGVERDRYERWSTFNQLQAWDLGVRLPDFILMHVDRCSMAHGLEARVPFLDHRLVELCASMPPEIKSGGRAGKRVLRDAMRGVLPEEIRTRPKRALRAPNDAWMRGRLPDFAEDLLSREAVADRGYFRPGGVERLRVLHEQGAAEAGKTLLAVLGVQLWDDIFVRGEGPGAALRMPVA